MKSRRFEYFRPGTLEEALVVLAESGDDAKVLAGGQSLVPAMNMRLVRPAVVVDLNHVDGLDTVSDETGSLSVQALVRQSDRRLREHRLLSEALPYVGHFVTRNRGTVVGSVAHADPASELSLCLVLLDGAVIARAPRGERVIPATDFFLGPYTTALAADEVIVETRWPLPAEGDGFAFEELAQRAGDFALAMAAAHVHGDSTRVVVGAVTATPTVLDVDPERPGASAAAQVEPWESIHASPAYLKQLVEVLVDRAVARARREAAA